MATSNDEKLAVLIDGSMHVKLQVRRKAAPPSKAG
jgi:hypothetical protein